MCGMKTGAGEDPFADDERDDDGADEASNGDEADASGANAAEEDANSTGAARGAGESRRSHDGSREHNGAPNHDESPGYDRTPPDRQEMGGDEAGERIRPSELPFIARRNARGDNVKAGRDKRRLFELRPDIAEKEVPFLEDLERKLDEEVPKTDAREAALAVVYDRPDLVADKLEEWGVNYFDE